MIFERLDHAAMLAVVPFRKKPLVAILRLFTYSGTGYAWLLIAGALIVLHFLRIVFVPMQSEFLRALPAAGAAYLICIVLKRLVNRRRPPHAIPGYKPLARNPSCGSFPSGHAAAAFAFFTALLLLGHPAAWFVFTWAVLVCFSRFYLGVHFPTDILAGAGLGAGCGFALARVLLLYG